MPEKTIELELSLPMPPFVDAQDGCLERLEVALGTRKGIRRAHLKRETDPQKRSEIEAKWRNLRPPRRPDSVYQVSTIGEDYIGFRSEATEVLVPITSIRDIRRQAP